MAFSSSSFFTGVGIVLAAMSMGFGGGIVMTDAFVGTNETQPDKLEQRAAEAKAPPAPAPVVVGSQAAAGPVQPQIRPIPNLSAAAQRSPSMEQSAQLPRPPVQRAASRQDAVMGPEAPNPTSRLQMQTTMLPQSKAAARAEDAHAKANDAEVQREQKRQAKTRRAERRKAVAERKRRKDEELRTVAERMKQESRPTQSPVAGRLAQEEPRLERHVIVHDGGDDDRPLDRIFRLD
jgi:hypothetical protein